MDQNLNHEISPTQPLVLKNIPTATRAELQQANTPPVDRELEKRLQVFLMPEPQDLSEKLTHAGDKAAAIDYLRGRHDEPTVAYRLAEIMMTDKNKEIRKQAEQALTGTTEAVGKDLLFSQTLIRELGKGGDKFGSGPENPEYLMKELRARHEQPLVTARLMEILLDGSDGAYYAAEIFQKTPNLEIQTKLKELLRHVVDGNYSWLNGVWQLPRALKFSTDPEAQRLIIKALNINGMQDENFHCAAADAIGGIKSEEARAALLKNTFDPYRDWYPRPAIARALTEQMDEKLLQILKPAIAGSVLKTAWIVAGENSSWLLGRVFKTFSLINNRKEQIHEIRIQVALALKDKEPELAKLVFSAAVNGKSSFARKCHYFAACIAERELAKLEAVLT